jgi:hypothetical protein
MNSNSNSTEVKNIEDAPEVMDNFQVPKETIDNESNPNHNILKEQFQEKLDIANDEIIKHKNEIHTLKVSISEIGKERDFYYSKLRDIEFLFMKNANLEKDALTGILKTILYSEKEIELSIEEGKVNIK